MLGGKIEVPTLDGKTEIKVNTLVEKHMHVLLLRKF
jgi:hypothetical protein